MDKYAVLKKNCVELEFCNMALAGRILWISNVFAKIMLQVKKVVG